MYAPGKTVTYRLGKHDSDIADYLNSIQAESGSVAEAHRKGLRVHIRGITNTGQAPSVTSVNFAEDLHALHLRMSHLEAKLAVKLDQIQAILEALCYGTTGQAVEELSRTKSEMSSALEDSEDLKAAMEDLIDF